MNAVSRDPTCSEKRKEFGGKKRQEENEKKERGWR